MTRDEPRSDTWDPDRYERFRTERERAVHDLLGLVVPSPGGRAADLGCGTGRYTPILHERAQAGETVGVDSSARMLENSPQFVRPGVRFTEGDLAVLGGETGRWDVLFANASLQWIGDHPGLLHSLVDRLAPKGQLVFQVPANFDHPSHTVADEVGREFGLEPLARGIASLRPARYAEILWAAGLREVDVTLRVYGMALDRTDDVIAWVSGSLLTRFEERLSPADFERFGQTYRARLLDALGDPDGGRPYYYAFARILCRGRLP